MLAYLLECFGLDLSDTFAGNRENLAHFFQSMGHSVGQSEPHVQYLLLPRSKVGDYLIYIRFEYLAGSRR